MMQTCPVCNGSGTVSERLYYRTIQTNHSERYVTCRSCNGRGIVRDECPAPPPAKPDHWEDPEPPERMSYGYTHRNDGTVVDSDGTVVGYWDVRGNIITYDSVKC